MCLLPRNKFLLLLFAVILLGAEAPKKSLLVALKRKIIYMVEATEATDKVERYLSKFLF